MQDIIPKPEIASELLERRRVREDLVSWATYYGKDRGWVPALHHRLLLSTLQAVTDGKLVHSKTGNPCRRIMVLMPPGSAKSSYTSVIYPTWAIQRFIQNGVPNPRIIGCSHSAELIESFSRECRNSIQTHHRILGYNLRSDSRAVHEWSTTNGASYVCVGVGAGLAGRRSDIGAIDDYLGSQEDADSKLIRDKQWAWYINDFWPRLKPNAIQIIVANRRHEDDLVGRIQDKEEQKWEIISIPFFAEDNDCLGRAVGERLWPEWFTADMAEEVKALPPRTFGGLYQQRPAPEEGNYFKRDWLLTYTRDEYDALMAKNPRIYGAGDWAVSEEDDANRSCFGGAALDEQGFLYILPDLFWKIAGPKEVCHAFVDFMRRRNPLMFWSEKGHISKAWGPFLREMMLDEQVYGYITEITPARAKDVRARSIQGRMSMLRVKFPSFASWWPSAMHELLMFPGGKTDDFTDFLAHLGAGVNSMAKTVLVKPEVDETVLGDWRPTMGWLKKESKRQASRYEVRYQGR